MRSPEALRAEVGRLLAEARTSEDLTLRQSLAARALVFAQEAEAIARLPDDAEGLRLRIAQYRYTLGRAGEPKQRVIAQMLRDAEGKLQQISRTAGRPRQDRLAVA